VAKRWDGRKPHANEYKYTLKEGGMAETEKGVGAEPRDVGAQLVGPGDFAAGSRTRWGDQKEAQWMMQGQRNWIEGTVVESR